MGRFYSVTEEYGEKFYRIPKVFQTNPKYKKLKANAKLAWAMLRDRHDLSVRNEWIDEQGRVYFIFGRNKLAEILDVTPKTATSIRNELVDYGLLYIEDQGNGNTDKLYLLKPETTMDDVYKIRQQEEEILEKPNVINGSKNWGKNYPGIQGKNYSTTRVKNTPPLGEILPPNDTDYIKTDKNNTDNKRIIHSSSIESRNTGYSANLVKNDDDNKADPSIGILLEDLDYKRHHVHEIMSLIEKEKLYWIQKVNIVKQHYRVTKELKKGNITKLAEFFVNGLKMHATQDSIVAQSPGELEPKITSKPPFYNWLKEEEQKPLGSKYYW